ncbi:MAG: ammonia-forming cytochrome c nitrite reductase subunit c552 [Kiritimatiellia bacterium]
MKMNGDGKMSMGSQNPKRTGTCGRLLAIALATVVGLGAWNAYAASSSSSPTPTNLFIYFRPLTTQEIKNYALTNAQLAAGGPNVGIGQPAYLEALLTKKSGTTGFTATQVTWTVVQFPVGSSTNVLKASPLGAAVPTYDHGDQLNYSVAGRSMLVPDVVGSTGKGDYKVVVSLMVSNRLIVATNIVFGSKYQGMYSGDDFGCEMCHPDKVATFVQTQHATAFTRKINGEAGAGFKSTCTSCHVLGYDTTAAATNGGFDDVALQTGWLFPTNLATAGATNNWAAMPTELQIKANIQCESCHGAGRRHMLGGGSTNMGLVSVTLSGALTNPPSRGITISMSAGNCGQCHDAMTHHTKNYQWGLSGHGLEAPHTSESCKRCHATSGFIDVNDPGVDFNGNIVTTRGTRYEGITCAACHDPHTKGMSDYQLRNITSVAFSNGVTRTEGGSGLLCMKCHRNRDDVATNVVKAVGQSTSVAKPHYSIQGDMMFGMNGVELWSDMPSSRHWSVVEDTCVGCHMQEPYAGMNTNALNQVGGHTWKIAWTSTNGVDEVNLTEACAGCHGEIENFNIGGEDYDQNGRVEGVQTEITNMMYRLAMLLGTNASPTTTGISTNNADYFKRAAYYNWWFVYYDGSKGVHNPKYAAALLRSSIDALTQNFVDVNHNGVLDTWEMANFGNLTTVTATSDYDHDGLTDYQEWAAGTNPKLSDSDYDGFSDLVELQGGSDPWSGGSTPMTNTVFMLPALELEYLPPTSGQPMHFQQYCPTNIPSLGWTNIEPGFISDTNKWFYQLISTHSCSQKLFRVKSDVP